MSKPKKPVDPLQEDLKRLAVSANRAKNQITFHTHLRTYGKMAEFFGLRVRDIEQYNKPIWKPDVDIFARQLEHIIKDQYASKKRITEFARSGILEASDGSAPVTTETVKESDSGGGVYVDTDSTTYNPKYPDQKAILRVKDCNQEGAARALWRGIEHGKWGQMLISPTQTGKTFMLGSLIKNFVMQGMVQKLNCFAPWPVWYVTKATVIEQTENVLKEFFNLGSNIVSVINVEHLRSKMGKHYVKEEVVIIDNQEHILYEWTPLMYPCLIIFDECHMFIRAHSIQSQIAQGLNRVDNCYKIFASATPLSRVSEGKVFACATKKTFQLGLADVVIDEGTWPAFAKQIAAPARPEDHTIAAKERYTEFFNDCIVRVKNIRPKFKAKNELMPMSFQTKEEYDFYNTALERYYKQKAEIEGNEHLSGSEQGMALLAAFTILRHAAEECKVNQFIEFADKTWKAGYAPFLGLAFKRPICMVIRGLIEQRGWSRDDISVVWGGSQETLNTKKKLAKQIKENSALMDALGEAGIDLNKIGIKLDELNEKTQDQLEFEKKYNLLKQSREQREIERLRYKRQDSRILLYSYKSGGVGLSASHEDGYGDKVRPRQGCLSLVYNEKELVQGIGRPHAITSISETLIMFPYYQGTIEEDVAIKVKQKLRCLRAGTGAGESWESIITGNTATDVSRPEIMDAVDQAENALIEV